MRLLVTGGTGFIGSHVLKQALVRGDRLTVMRRPGSVPRVEIGAGVVWLESPLDTLGAADLAGHDAVLHLASVGVSPQKATLDEMIRWNVGVTGRVLAAAGAAGVHRVVVAGSFAEYGRAADRFAFLPVDAPLEPTSAYAASKAAACMIALAMAAQYGLELCYLRIFSAYGEGQHESNFFPSLRRAAMSGEDFHMTAGEQVRDFVPVEDVAKAILEAASCPGVVPGCPRVVNVASGQPVALRDFAEHWWRRLGARGRLVVGSVPYRSAEPKRFAAEMSTWPDGGFVRP